MSNNIVDQVVRAFVRAWTKLDELERRGNRGERAAARAGKSALVAGAALAIAGLVLASLGAN